MRRASQVQAPQGQSPGGGEYEVVRGLAQLEHGPREGNDIWKVSLEWVLNDQLKILDFIL